MRVDLLEHLIITHDAAYGIIKNQLVNLGEEKQYSLPDEQQRAAETETKKFLNLPFQPRTLNKKMSELAKPKTAGEN
jgi:hypothetical protein